MKRDRDLIAGFLQGSSRDLEELVRRYEGRVYNTIFHMVGNREEARDLTQETFLRMLKGLGELRDPGKFFPWLMRIASNLVRDRLRGTSPQTLEGAWEEMPGDDGNEPLRMLETQDARERLLRTLVLLPPRQRMAVVLRIYNELPFKEVAHIMECSEATARSLFWAGVREMRRRLGAQE